MSDIPNQPRRPRFHITPVEVFVLVVIFGLLIALVLPASQSSNCGGNSAALAACRYYALLVESWNLENPNGGFLVKSANPHQIEELKLLPGRDWVRTGTFLVKADTVHIKRDATKEIVIVCDKAYNNVPRHRFWKAPMTHAVGYSNGETGLITTDEFAKLDVSRFVDLATIADR